MLDAFSNVPAWNAMYARFRFATSMALAVASGVRG